MNSVLVVEDDADLRAAVADILEDEGFVVHVAENGRDALEELGHMGHMPCVVLLDLMMPVMDGFAFMERFRADPVLSQVPVVVFSASVREPPEGASAMIRKPFEIPALLSAVAGYCPRE
ncbi:response regulator [Pyxidicoccus xibeiensis]|uniref:response regulator n=1 Tax=Pyxidicoccus xibeiensis TaxID=2906759 RepID=UPI0020A768FC|nr:response regulator [Pyxidicoccus xibeiensis]MCP3139968.1 response regulator [Pyxidicoccus xibeiensis]